MDFFVQTEVDEGVEGEGRVSDPRVAVVPVLGSADPLGERGGGGRGDGAGMLGEQRLERQRGSAHREVPGAVACEQVGPAPPGADGPVEPGLNGVRRWKEQRLGVGGHHGEQRSGPFVHPGLTGHAVGGDHGRPEAVEDQPQGLVLDAGDRSAVDDG